MKIIDFSNITSTAWQPFEQITWEVLQLSYYDVIRQTLIAQIGTSYSSSTVYVLWGCVPTVGVSTTVISAGAVFTNGEVFLYGGSSVANPTGSNVIVANMLTTNLDTDSGSGTLFSDGSYHHVHLDRTVSFSSAGLTGTGNLNGGASVNNDLANFQQTGTSKWANGPVLTFVAIGGGSISGGTVSYNKYRIIGKTIEWQVQLVGATISSPATLIEVNSPMTTLGADFANNGMEFAGSYSGGSFPITPSSLLIVKLTGSLALGNISLAVPGGFTYGSANSNFFISIIAEMP